MHFFLSNITICWRVNLLDQQEIFEKQSYSQSIQKSLDIKEIPEKRSKDYNSQTNEHGNFYRNEFPSNENANVFIISRSHIIDSEKK